MHPTLRLVAGPQKPRDIDGRSDPRGFCARVAPHIVSRMPIYEHLAVRYHDGLPERVRQYLISARGISDAMIDKHQLGWNGERIAIPVRDRRGMVGFFKLAKAPGDVGNSPKMLTTFGARAELYGWERALAPIQQVIICEGELDRLVLESRGYAAVTSTAGALTFRREWAAALRRIPSIYICFDRDAAGDAGARLVASMLPEAKIVTLPPQVGLGGDVSDYFLGLGSTIEDFDALLEAALPIPEHERLTFDSAPKRARSAHAPSEAAALKADVRIEDWIGADITLTVKGKRYAANCPFHEDRTPSFTVFPDTQLFYCFGCRARGDVFTYLMRSRQVSFAEALDIVRRAVQSGNGQATS